MCLNHMNVFVNVIPIYGFEYGNYELVLFRGIFVLNYISLGMNILFDCTYS